MAQEIIENPAPQMQASHLCEVSITQIAEQVEGEQYLIPNTLLAKKTISLKRSDSLEETIHNIEVEYAKKQSLWTLSVEGQDPITISDIKRGYIRTIALAPNIEVSIACVELIN